MSAKAKKKLDTHATIKPQKNEFADEFLDVVGAEFKFDHAKGLAEWIKNCADAYSTTAKVKDAEQHILLRFKQGNPKKDSIFECIDFVGMTKQDIDKALKVWGLSTAAAKGTDVKTFGGHGNGGKFYMRQMFGTSRFITFRDDRLNVFGFDEKRRYGYAYGFENRESTLVEALKFAELDGLEIPEEVLKRWKKKPAQAGFTVVRGEHPHRFSGRSTISTILERLRFHPQARRVLAHKQVAMLGYGEKSGELLTLPEIKPKEGFEDARVIPLPKKFEHGGETFEFRDKAYPDGKLTLRTSEVPLTRTGDLAALNSIDILGEVGCIGSYRMNELGFMRFAPESEFIFGECECSMLEDKERDCVRNDREKLVPNELTAALLEWIKQQVDKLAEEMAEKRQEEKKSRDLRESALFNQFLDKWKNKFMAKMNAEIFGGTGIGGSFGGAGGGGGESGGGGGGGGGGGDGGGGGSTGTRDGEKDGAGGGSGDTTKKAPRFPRVLLSDYDMDPLDPTATKPLHCDERHPPVYQRRQDIEAGIYWINTRKPLAVRIMDTTGSKSPRWREYLFQRYTDIILKQSIYELNRRDPELTAEKVDGLIDDVTSRVHDAASSDLESFLFAESMTGTVAAPTASDDDAEAEETEVELPMAAEPGAVIPSMGEMLSSEFKTLTTAKRARK